MTNKKDKYIWGIKTEIFKRAIREEVLEEVLEALPKTSLRSPNDYSLGINTGIYSCREAIKKLIA